MRIKFYTPEGSEPFTDRVEMANVETHLAAGDDRAYEAGLLAEFARLSYDQVSEIRFEGDVWRLVEHGGDTPENEFYLYELVD